MLQRREATLDWISEHVYRVLPLSGELQQINVLFPGETMMKIVRPYYSGDMGRGSEDPVLLTKIMLLSFFYAIDGDENTVETVRYRMDWRQLCDLPLDAPLPGRTTLVKFRRKVGLAVIEGMFQAFLDDLVRRGVVDRHHRFFDGTPATARARINPYRDEVYQETLAALEEKLTQFHTRQVACDSALNQTPVQLTRTHYAADNTAVEMRWEQPLKSVSERVSAGDAEARFQRGKHGKRSVLG